MGAGICGAILLEFELEACDKKHFLEESANNFLDYYNQLPKEKNSFFERFIIKDEILLPNYADFLKEFYDLIYIDFKGIRHPYDEPNETYTNSILNCKTRKEFDNVFAHDERNGTFPCISSSVSCLCCDINNPFIFYFGSYKAYLEEYTTFTHMERMLNKAMTNPLKNVVKFGIG